MVIIFCGVPGSGKSTIARALAKKIKKLGSYKILISDKVSGRVYEKISEFLKENLGKVDYILIDATFYKKKWRDMVYKLAKAGGQKALTVYLHCSLDTCISRNKMRKPHIPEKAIYIISHQMEKPRYPDQVGRWVASINTDKIKPKEAVLQILRKLS